MAGAGCTHHHLPKKFFALGERRVNAADINAGDMARALFVHEEGIRPTNNAAEQSSELLPNGARSCSATAAPTANWPLPVSSR